MGSKIDRKRIENGQKAQVYFTTYNKLPVYIILWNKFYSKIEFFHLLKKIQFVRC